MPTAVERINSQLHDSPYLLPPSGAGEEAAKRVAKTLQNLGRRARRLHETFKLQNAALRRQVADDMAVRRVYESNALEGLGADLITTYEAVHERKGRSVDDILRDRGVSRGLKAEPKLADVYSLDDAYRFADELARSRPFRLREIDLRTMQGLITRGKIFAGNYKQKEVEIRGSKHQPVPVIEVQSAVRDLIDWCNATTAPPPLKAAVVHAWLTHIHPFEDGNGRTARVLANVMLACEGYPPLIVRSSSDRGAYLAALGASDEAGNLLQFLDLFAKALNRGVYELERPEVSRKLLLDDLYGAERGDYLAWHSLLALFTRDLNRLLVEAGFKFGVVGHLTPSDLQLLQGYSEAGNAWYARARQVDGPASLLLWFGFNSILYRDQMGAESSWPSILFSERNRAPLAQHPYSPLTDTGRMEIDEVVLLPGQQKPIALRQGLEVRPFALAEGVELVARAITLYAYRKGKRLGQNGGS